MQSRMWPLVTVAALVVACSGDRTADDASAAATSSSGLPGAETGDSGSSEIAAVFAPDLGVDLSVMAKLPSGLYMKDIEVGDGDLAINGKRLSVKYTGWLSNGVEFDSNRDSDETMSFTLGIGDVIKGWEEGMQGMRPGGRRMFVIPPGLAYGDRGYPGLIPPGSTLVFDVTLVEVRD